MESHMRTSIFPPSFDSVTSADPPPKESFFASMLRQSSVLGDNDSSFLMQQIHVFCSDWAAAVKASNCTVSSQYKLQRAWAMSNEITHVKGRGSSRLLLAAMYGINCRY